VVAVTVVAASLLTHTEFVVRDRHEQRDSAEASAQLVAARVQGRLRGVLLTLETAAASSAEELDDRTASMRARGVITAAARVSRDGEPQSVVGDAALVEPGTTPAFNTARDTGHAGLDRRSGRAGLVGVAPIYHGVPVSTDDRRNPTFLDGYVVGVVDVDRLVRDSLPPDTAMSARLSDDTTVVASVGTVRRGGPESGEMVEAGGQTYLLTVRLPAAPARFPAVPLGGIALGALSAFAVGLTARARRRAERSATVREETLTLLADLGALLQESLDLEVILPAAAVRLSEQLRLEGFAVLRADRRGRLVHAFSLGTSPTGELSGFGSLRSPEVVPARAEALFPLQPAGRVTGALWIRTRRSLDAAAVRSLQAAADLLASALANADAFDQERESVRRLEELDRIKNRFIGTVSHEMRTSASAISGFANLLASRWGQLDDEERRDLVVRIDRNGQSLVSVVEDFLDFSRLERRSPASDPPPDSLSELVATAADDLAALADQHRIVTRITDHVTAFVDRQAVDRILTNLVSNAAKFSPEGGEIRLEISE